MDWRLSRCFEIEDKQLPIFFFVVHNVRRFTTPPSQHLRTGSTTVKEVPATEESFFGFLRHTTTQLPLSHFRLITDFSPLPLSLSLSHTHTHTHTPSHTLYLYILSIILSQFFLHSFQHSLSPFFLHYLYPSLPDFLYFLSAFFALSPFFLHSHSRLLSIYQFTPSSLSIICIFLSKFFVHYLS